MSIAESVREVERRIAAASGRAGRSPSEVTLVAVTKNVLPLFIREAFEAGVRHFGENRVQEARAKMRELADLNSRVAWHMVGRLQANKVKTATEIFDIIHSVDSVELAESISARAAIVMPLLIQVNVSGEVSKAGLSPRDLDSALQRISRLRCLSTMGLMTIAPEVADPEQARPVFRELHSLAQRHRLPHLSMGMSADFEVAVEEGATMVRIGRALFGERDTGMISRSRQ